MFSYPNISNLIWEGFHTPKPPWTGLSSTAGVGGGMNQPSNVLSMSYLREKLDANLLRSGMGVSPVAAEA